MTRCNDQVSASTLGADSFENVRRGPTGRRRSLLEFLGLDFFLSADDTNTAGDEDILRLLVELFIVRRAIVDDQRNASRTHPPFGGGVQRWRDGAAKGEDKLKLLLQSNSKQPKQYQHSYPRHHIAVPIFGRRTAGRLVHGDPIL
jgi:hypothetical protein